MTQHHGVTRALAHAIDKRSIVNEVPYALRTYTTDALGGNRVDHGRYTDGPDAMPVGTARTVLPSTSGVHLVEEEFVPFVQGRELYLLRTRPHLYFEEQVESGIEHAQTIAKARGHLLADCHTCQLTMPVALDTERCATCGSEF